MGTLVKLGSQLKTVLDLGKTFHDLLPPLVCGLATLAKGRTKDKEAVDQLPKRPGNAYALFVKDNHAAVQAKHPKLKTSEVMKHTAQLWKIQSPLTKQRYAKQHETLMQAYKQRAQATEPPKRPPTPYAAYLRDQFTAVRKRHQNLQAFEIMKVIGRKWQVLDTGSKQRYAKAYKFQMEKYNANLTQKDIDLIEMKKDSKAAKDKKQMVRKYGKAAMKEQPKKSNISPFAIFIEEKKGVINGKDFLKNAGAEWRKLSDTQRKVYSEKANERRKSYEAEVDAWEKKHL